MEEAQVTVDGTTRPVPQPFTVIATQNSVGPGRTYELPIAERDRFIKRIELGYPTAADEREILTRATGHHPIESLDPVASSEELRRAQATAAAVTLREPVREYAVDLATYTREHARLGVSPRGTIALLRAAQARALLSGREYVIPDDVQREAPVVLPHRIENEGDPEDSLVARALERVAVP
jgi:MoxR-like ATPase